MYFFQNSNDGHFDNSHVSFERYRGASSYSKRFFFTKQSTSNLDKNGSIFGKIA